MEWTIRVLNAEEIDLAGMIGKGIAADFAHALEANPGLRMVHVNVGRGGLLKEAWKIADLIHQAGLDTYVPRNCGAACTIVVSGGINRYLRDGAKLGYTNYEIPQTGLLDVQHWQMLYKVQLLDDFAAKAVAMAPGKLWVPSNDELMASGAVTEIVNGEKFAASGVAIDAAGIEQDLLELRVFQVIKLREPEQFSALIDKLQHAAAQGMPVEQIRLTGINWLGGLRAKYVPYADDRAVNALIQHMLAAAESVAAQDQAACYAFLSGGAVPGAERAVALIPADLRRHEPDLLADIFESADPARPLPEKARTDALFEEIVKKMGPDGALLEQTADPNLAPETGCRVSLSLYRSTLTLPPDDSAAVFKSWYLP